VNILRCDIHLIFCERCRKPFRSPECGFYTSTSCPPERCQVIDVKPAGFTNTKFRKGSDEGKICIPTCAQFDGNLAAAAEEFAKQFRTFAQAPYEGKKISGPDYDVRSYLNTILITNNAVSSRGDRVNAWNALCGSFPMDQCSTDSSEGYGYRCRLSKSLQKCYLKNFKP
jgi:hypothetical protein